MATLQVVESNFHDSMPIHKQDEEKPCNNDAMISFTDTINTIRILSFIVHTGGDSPEGCQRDYCQDEQNGPILSNLMLFISLSLEVFHCIGWSK